MSAFGTVEEFEVKAAGHATEKDRIWTRTTMAPCTFIADQAVSRLGYARAEVVNTYGGTRSDPLYVAEKLGSHFTEES